MFNYQLSDIIEGGNISNDRDKNFDGKVYFLLKQNKVIYVGQSKSLKNRLMAHSDKDFDDMSFICVPEHSLNDVEAFYIVKFNPELNRAIPSSNLYVGTGKVRSMMIEILDSTAVKMINDVEVAYETKKGLNPKYKQKTYIKSTDSETLISKFRKHMNEFIRLGE